MKLLIDPTKLKEYRSRDKIPIECEHCHKIFTATKNNILRVLKSSPNRLRFCTRSCNDKRKHKRKTVKCKNCQKDFQKLNCYCSKNNFCSKSCAAKYNNTHKTTGTRRSKLEKWIEEQLTILYPNLEIHFNKTSAVNAELDVFIPSLKLAFELNGIFHYEPIYSEEKLSSTQNNDKRKFQACLERGIELCIIDTSSQEYFKENTSKKYLDIIIDVLNKKLVGGSGIEPLSVQCH